MAAGVLIVLSLIGIFGMAISTFRWASESRRAKTHGIAAAPRGAAEDFATAGQRGSLLCAIALLLIVIITTPTVLVLHLTGPRGGPTQDIAATLAAALALVLATLLIIPTIATQVAWTWRRRTPAAEAAVLARTVSGRRRTIIAARVITVTAWTMSTGSACVLSVLLVDQMLDQAQAVAGAYSRYDAATAVRSELLEDYVVGDVHCPHALSDPSRSATIHCRVTSLGRSDSIAATWDPSGYGTGTIHVLRPETAGLTRTSELSDQVPTPVAPDRLISGTEMRVAVRSQMLAEGWSDSSSAVHDLTCPGVDAGYGPGLVRCTIRKDPETQRWLDVYPVAHDHVIARTAEIADLPH